MSTVLKLTVAEFDRLVARGAFDGLAKRVELVHGELLEMNPAGPLHEDILSVLTRWSTTHTSANEVTIRVQCGLGIPQLNSVPEPDVTWVRRGRYRRRRPQPADVLLVIEVADTSLDYDLGTKQQIYAAAGVKEYWVVDVSGERLTVFRSPSKHGYRKTEEYSSGQRVSPTAVPRAVLDLGELFGG